MGEIRKLEINIPDDDVTDLKRRLAATRWTDQETVDDWSQGIPLAYLQDVCAYWEHGYDWRRCEEQLNSFPHFKTDFDGLDIHFIHVESPEPDATPLLITHGWPGSIIEFQKVIEPLTDPRSYGGDPSDAFHLVCPSLPGYGFSDKPTTTGWGPQRIAEAWATLMHRLGHDRYICQGGDWGAVVSSCIAEQDPDHCLGIHLNMVTAPPTDETLGDLTEAEKSALATMEWYELWDRGYGRQQCTRPQTLGYGLADSPVGQAAWILEKFHRWTDCDGHPENVLTRDELLDNVMLYWLTATGTSSARLYWETQTPPEVDIRVPVAASIFPAEMYRPSRRWCEAHYKSLAYYNLTEKGGHFAAFEQPEIFVDEVRAAVRAIHAFTG